MYININIEFQRISQASPQQKEQLCWKDTHICTTSIAASLQSHPAISLRSITQPNATVAQSQKRHQHRDGRQDCLVLAT